MAHHGVRAAFSRAWAKGGHVNAVECRIDQTAGMTVIRCLGDLDGAVVLRHLRAFWEQHPEIVDTNCVVDVRHYVGNMSFAHIKAIAMAWYGFSGRRDVRRRTAIVSADRFAALLMKAVGVLFDTRDLKLFRDIDEADRWCREGAHGAVE